jgi:murein L,D-transpeptidase YcbB/YkuD
MPGGQKSELKMHLPRAKDDQVKLAKTIPVLVLYDTAIAEEDGRVFFFKDIYGTTRNC